MTTPLLFKVLSETLAPTHGTSTFRYPMPQDGEPGAWTRTIANPVPCKQGYHLTALPERWWQRGARLFLAEYRGAIVPQADGCKLAAESVRLVREVDETWELLPMFPVIRALLASSWRHRNGPDAQWPAWADLRGADLRGAYLSGAYLRGAYLSGANLSRADLRRADLSRADLRRADLSGADLVGADLSGADLVGAYLSGANLSGADLSRAYLRGAYLSGANLSRADLRRADLRGAYLSRADLGGAYLSGADLGGADLGGAYLGGANLGGANLGGARPAWLPAEWDVSVDPYGWATAVRATAVPS